MANCKTLRDRLGVTGLYFSAAVTSPALPRRNDERAPPGWPTPAECMISAGSLGGHHMMGGQVIDLAAERARRRQSA